MSPELRELQWESGKAGKEGSGCTARMGEGGESLGVLATSPERVWDSKTMAIGNHGSWPTSSREGKLPQIVT